jgi:hypothetical protein
MKIDTVNVIEMNDNDLISVQSFEESESGNKEAEVAFSKLALSKGSTQDEMEVWLEDGYYETGNFQLFLSHSA